MDKWTMDKSTDLPQLGQLHSSVSQQCFPSLTFPTRVSCTAPALHRLNPRYHMKSCFVGRNITSETHWGYLSWLLLPKFSAFFHQDGFVEMILPLLGVIHGSSTAVMNKTTVARLQ